jgi:hypothetical protein
MQDEIADTFAKKLGIIEQVALDNSSSSLKNHLQNTQTLQLFTMIIKIESRKIFECQTGWLGCRDQMV